MIIETSTLDISAVVRAFDISGGMGLTGIWRPLSSPGKTKTFRVFRHEPSDTLQPDYLLLQVSDGRSFRINQTISSYQESQGEDGLAWRPLKTRPTVQTPNGPRVALNFEEHQEREPDAADPPQLNKKKWWGR